MNTKSFAMAGSLLAACALFGSLMSCTPEEKPGKPGTDPEEPEKLENQIKLDDALTDIKTVLYEKDGEEWTFWLSPREGIVLVADMEKEDDYLKVSVKSPKGTVDVTKEEFTIKYKDVTVSKVTAGTDFSKVELQADALQNDGKVTLNLYVLVESKAGSCLTARYNGAISEGIGKEVAENTWRLDTETAEQIRSVVRTPRFASDYINNVALSMSEDYYLYNEDGKTTPAGENETAKYIKVSISKDLKGGTRHDLATVDRNQLKIVCGDLDLLAADPAGTFIFSTANGFNMEIDAAFQKDGKTSYFKANCSQTEVQNAYESDNKFVFVADRNTAATSTRTIGLKKVFHDKKNTGGYVLAFGLKEDPAAPADLMDPEARYAVEVRLAPADVQNRNVIDLAKDRTKAEVIIYDYEEYSTLKFSEVTSGDGLQYNIGAMYAEQSGENLFFYMDVFFGPGEPGLKLVWNGPVTEVDGLTDLTPVRPAAPNFIGKAPEGTDPATGSLYKKITGLTIKEVTRVVGAEVDAYEFTLHCEKTEIEEQEEQDPRIILSFKKEDVDKGRIDVTSRQQTSGYQILSENFLFSVNMKDSDNWWGWNFITSGQITNTLPYMPGPTAGYIEVSGEPGGTWKISFEMTNSYVQYGSTSGDGDIVTISYEGPAEE